ncbi:MAG: zinc-binding dehydrogenase, partial [Chloroflexota bacterium]
MLQATISGERQVEFVELPDPQPKADWALVKVHASALCTEYKAYVSGHKLPIMGHEGTGEVVAVAQPGLVNVGDRVVILPQYPCGTCALCLAGDYVYCEDNYNYSEFNGARSGSGTFAHYTLKPSWLLPKIPDGVSYAEATMAIDGVGASFGGMEAINVTSRDTVLVTGLGPVGLGAIVNAQYRGATVIGVEPAPWRADLAREMGAKAVLNPLDEDILEQILALTDGRGVDCAVDCSGRVSSERLCIDATRRRGRIAFVGECSNELSIRVSPDMIRKGLTVVGSWLYNRADYPKVMQVIQESPLIDKLISHEMPMSEIQDAFEILARGESA